MKRVGTVAAIPKWQIRRDFPHLLNTEVLCELQPPQLQATEALVFTLHFGDENRRAEWRTRFGCLNSHVGDHCHIGAQGFACR
jgi:hypothetical protein